MSAKNPVEKKANEIKIKRLYDAPVETVWGAWTDPAQAAQWWGPRGFTITTHSKDLRAGGIWHYTMHGPDGRDYPNKTVYHEVETHKKLVYDHGGNDAQAPMVRVTVLFFDKDGKTEMDMTMALPSAEALAQTQKIIKEAGGNATWDRLAEYLQKGANGKEVFVINRSFAVPIDGMFDMWAKPEHMTQWMAPKGFQMELFVGDVRTGGKTFYKMWGHGIEMYGRAQFLKVEKPNLLVYTQQFCDKDENISRHPMAPVWPETMLTRVDFAAEGDAHTRVTITWEPTGNVTDTELQAFIAARGGMTMGWTGSFDKLEDYCATHGTCGAH